jgi:nucleotide-binding universal stress UspA family protein
VYRRILMPIDGSSCSRHAIGEGLALAKAVGARVTFLNVLEDPRTVWHTLENLPRDHVLYHELESAAKKALHSAAEMAEAAGVKAEVVLLENENPITAIVRAAATYDLVIMGTHGRRGLDRLVLGSVTEGVLRQISTPQLVIRCPEQAL